MTTDTLSIPRTGNRFCNVLLNSERIERRNAKSVQRSKDAYLDAPKAGDTQVPEPVRDVISASGQQLDASIQRAMEERMGDNLGDVRIHTGPSAAQACEDINARAFTVGNHVAFNHGEYNPSSEEAQHVLAHELAHVRQQTGGAVSMLPQEGELRIDPDEQLEREAEETAQQVMRGGEIGVHRMRKSDVHIQRLSGVASSVKNMASLATDMRETEKAQQQQRADDFASMGQAEGDIQQRVSALEQQVSQLGDYVSEQVAPSELLDGAFANTVGQEGVKESLKLGATGLLASYMGAKTKNPEAAVGGAVIAQSGVETMWQAGGHTESLREVATPDIGTDKLGDLKETVSSIIDEQLRERFFGDQTGDNLIGDAQSRREQ